MASSHHRDSDTITQDIRRPTNLARLVGLAGPHAGRVHNLSGDPVFFGREERADIRIKSLEVSRRHARIQRELNGAWKLIDLNSANGTHVNGSTVQGELEIYFGDRIQLGKEALFVFTHQDGLEDQVLQLQKMEALGKLAGEVAHDFKNLLTVMFSTVAVLRKAQAQGDLTPSGSLNQRDLARHLDHMTEASERSNDLIMQLLTFSRPGTGSHGPVDLGEVVVKAVALCQETFPRGITLAHDVTEEIIIPADSGQVHQVVMNLLLNARDALEEGGEIRASCQRITLDTAGGLDVPFAPGDYVVISVSDNGPGIDDITKARVFEPFFTTKKSDKGSGLGLATVYAIAARHGGHALVESQPDQGTTLRVFFPVGPPPVTHEPAETAEPAETIMTSLLPTVSIPMRKSVLLALSDEDSIPLLISQLKAAGVFMVHVARTGAEAVNMFEEERRTIKLALVDKDLPDLTGLDVIRIMRRMYPEARLTLMAAELDPEEAAMARRAGALGVLPRNTSVGQIEEALRRAGAQD